MTFHKCFVLCTTPCGGSLPDKLNNFLWEIKRDESLGMNVPVRVYASEKLVKLMEKDRTLRQAKNAAALPGIVKNMLVMPDGHEGYGSPIGGVAAFGEDGGIVSPGFCGFDINCGVRVIRTNLSIDDVKPRIGALMDAMFRNVPSGVGSRMQLGFKEGDLEKISQEGVGYLVGKGYATGEDIEMTEEHGCIPGADFSKVGKLARQRGLLQLGTLGAGNHFAEVQVVDRVMDAGIAKAFGVSESQVVVMLHSGSRGYGHQVCSDYLVTMASYLKRNGVSLADPELCYADANSKEAGDYLAAMRSAVNFAFCNRQIMTHSIRKSFSEVFNKSPDALGMELLYDLSHNIVKLEEHRVDGRPLRLYVHRKGATRAFGPGRREITKQYRDIGQPVLIPGSMGTASYILAGRAESMAETFGSSCHGAGRVMSRHAALRDIPASKTIGEMARQGVEMRVRDRKLISEEAQWAYKDVDEVVASVVGAGISSTVAKLVPLGVTKG